MRNLTGALAATALTTAVALLGAQPAEACGGLFCSNNPVDQNAERILFEVGETGRITATVEITYAGDPSEFSWIVPVPEVPDQMDVAPVSSLRLLDNVTSPVIVPPPTTCSQSTGDFFRGVAPPSADFDAAVGAENDGGVIVTDLPVVGPFDPEVVEGTDAQELITWLDENGYVITEEMHPYIAEYVDQGYKFLAVKLTPDSQTQDISPLVFSCPQGSPLVPLKLTAVASEPEMGILVFVAGEGRYEPLNFRGLTVDTDLVQFDPVRFQSNYYPLVSWLIDEEGGKAFITEFAADSNAIDPFSSGLFTQDLEESQQWAEDLLTRSPYITRMYSRMSGWEMDDDPVFVLNPEGSDVSNIHDLSDRDPIEVCSNVVDPVPCGNTYCGVGSECAIAENGQAGCVCSGGTVARAITVPVGRGQPLGQSVFCQDTQIDMLQSLNGQLDVCGGFNCGDGGSCLPVNGFPTCSCDEGFVAINDFSQQSGLRCEAVGERFQPDQLLWPEFNAATCTCSTSNGKLPAIGGIALLLGLGGLMRRRRR
jgi:MYXO-CTERM domain-containing protein